ncbi:hypothetical protein [Deinococcus sp. YIM 77859]|nr:hypothetical protein [Deinococcus sp. YIM 77859]
MIGEEGLNKQLLTLVCAVCCLGVCLIPLGRRARRAQQDPQGG